MCRASRWGLPGLHRWSRTETATTEETTGDYDFKEIVLIRLYMLRYFKGSSDGTDDRWALTGIHFVVRVLVFALPCQLLAGAVVFASHRRPT